MHNPRQSRLALLISLVVFGGLTTIMMNAGGLQQEQSAERHNLFHVQIDARGDLGALAYDHVLVQDTLSYYAGEAAPTEEGESALWEMNYCCESPSLYSLGDEVVKLYQWWGDFTFADATSFDDFLIELLATKHIQIDRYEYVDGTMVGIATASLPIPGMMESSILLEEVRFNLKTIKA